MPASSRTVSRGASLPLRPCLRASPRKAADLEVREIEVGQRRTRQETVLASTKSESPAMTSTGHDRTADEESDRFMDRGFKMTPTSHGTRRRALRYDLPRLFKTIRDDRDVTLGALDLDLAHLGGHIGLDQEKYWPLGTASEPNLDGTITGVFMVVELALTLTNWPGHRAFCAVWNCAPFERAGDRIDGVVDERPASGACALIRSPEASASTARARGM